MLLFQNDDGVHFKKHGVDCQLWNGNEGLRGQRFTEHFSDLGRQHPKLGHVVIDDVDRKLGDLIRRGTNRVQCNSQICVGLRDLHGKVRRQVPCAVLAALSRNEGQ